MDEIKTARCEMSAKCFGQAGWTTLERDPLSAVTAEAGAGVLQKLDAAGYQWWSRIGDDGDGSVPLTIDVFARTQTPQFALHVRGNTGSFVETVYAEDTPAVMQLLGQWTQAAHGAAAVHLVATFRLHRDATGALPTIAGPLEHIGSAIGKQVIARVETLHRAFTDYATGTEREV